MMPMGMTINNTIMVVELSSPVFAALVSPTACLGCTTTSVFPSEGEEPPYVLSMGAALICLRTLPPALIPTAVRIKLELANSLVVAALVLWSSLLVSSRAATAKALNTSMDAIAKPLIARSQVQRMWDDAGIQIANAKLGLL
mmetsp:Transcript_105939/g.187577  ORF Transcript_105939/g.187577 Transcript_105939/m.187577 type:complete len:142 (-) Transcript_105939:12-437(-)